MMTRTRLVLLSLASFAAAGCGNAPPPQPQPDPEEVARFVAKLEARERARAGAELQRSEQAELEKARGAEAMVRTLDKSMPDELAETTTASLLRRVG